MKGPHSNKRSGWNVLCISIYVQQKCPEISQHHSSILHQNLLQIHMHPECADGFCVHLCAKRIAPLPVPKCLTTLPALNVITEPCAGVHMYYPSLVLFYCCLVAPILKHQLFSLKVTVSTSLRDQSEWKSPRIQHTIAITALTAAITKFLLCGAQISPSFAPVYQCNHSALLTPREWDPGMT